jgi:GT2 family glycosyltransferase
MSPRVSVIVPVRDRRELLAHALEALAGQTYRDYEVVVVDDGSTDGSGKEAEIWGERGMAVTVVRTDGVGAVAARCAGVEAAHGEILAFTDSDCAADPGWLAAGIETVDRGADVVQGLTVPMREIRALEHAVGAQDDALYNTCNVFYRRAAYEAAGGFDRGAGARLGFRPGDFGRSLGFGEDVLLGWRVRREGSAAFAPDAIVRHQVLRPPPAELVRRAWMTGGFPALIREVPELRSTLLRHGVLLGRSRVPMYVLAAALLLRRRRLAAASAAWWVASRARETARSHGTTGLRAVALPAELARDVVTGAALVMGSVRARSVVL